MAFRTGASIFKHEQTEMEGFSKALHRALSTPQLLNLKSGYGIEFESQIIFQLQCYLKLNLANLNKIEVSK